MTLPNPNILPGFDPDLPNTAGAAPGERLWFDMEETVYLNGRNLLSVILQLRSPGESHRDARFSTDSYLTLQQLNKSIDTETIDGTTFELCPIGRPSQTPGWVALRKNRNFTNRYLALAREFKGCRMVEVGVDKGGSTSFFTKLFRPEKLLAVELSDQPVPSVMNFLAKNDPRNTVSIHWGVDQSDPVRIPALVDDSLSQQPLDLVVDDASHLLAPTSATFEMLFPRLRPNGLYIIEDWPWRHLKERGVTMALDKNENDITAKHGAALDDYLRDFEMPMSLLICQLVIAAGFKPDWITEIRATDGFCEIRRGDADIAPNTPISDYIGYVGGRMFNPGNG